MENTNLREKLAKGGMVFGTWNIIPSAPLVNAICSSGIDFIVIDSEHGPVDMEKAEDLVRAAEVAEVPALIRVGANMPHMILKALDIGSSGVHVPHVSTKEEAIAVVSAAKYHPEGCRGYSPFTRAGGYGMKAKDHARLANENTIVVAHIEGAPGVKNLKDILDVPGIDVVFIGPYDLSQSLGKPGKVEDPQVLETVKRCAKMIRGKGKVCGSFAADEKYLDVLIDCGVRYLTYKVDSALIAETYKGIYSEFKKRPGL
ncbi:MAG: aldolase/citrate lyase family protein [Candidatus Omnitrophota bacterium]